jgi:DNA-binding NarL/FixJ family response regulator
MRTDCHIWILDDHPLVLQAMRTLILQDVAQAHIETFDSVKSLLAYRRQHPSPDLVLLDWYLPDGSAMDVLRAFDRDHDDSEPNDMGRTLQFMIVSAGDPIEIEKHLQQLHVIRPVIVYKHQSMHELSSMIKATVSGKNNPTIHLTARQSEMLSLIEQGLTNTDIAVRLSISVSTVKAHLADIFKKLQVQSRTQALHKWKSMTRY